MYHSALTTALQVHLNDVLNLIPANYTTTQITCTSIKFTPSLIILVHQDGSYYEDSARSSSQENVSMKNDPRCMNGGCIVIVTIEVQAVVEIHVS